MGASQVPRAANEQASCQATGCHNINPLKLKKWNDDYKSIMTKLNDDSLSVDDKINALREDPRHPESNFMPERAGIMTAGVHLQLAPQVDPTKHPEAYKQGQMLAQLFQGKDDMYAQFRSQMLMPVLEQFPRLTATQYETILTWFKRGMPKLNEIIPEDRPTECVENYGPLKDRASQVKTQNWTSQNKSNGIAMLGCPPEATSPTDCLKQKDANGADIFTPNDGTAHE